MVFFFAPVEAATVDLDRTFLVARLATPLEDRAATVRAFVVVAAADLERTRLVARLV